MPESTRTQEFSIGCAGWAIRKEHAHLFPGDETHLSRYSRRLGAVELNSSFYRPHSRATYQRWAASVPETFRFSVKAPKEITHERRFVDAIVPLEKFLEQITGLDDRLGPVLLQLPPSMEHCRVVAGRFLEALRARFGGAVVVEPRHASWFTNDVEKMLESLQIARVAADPCIVPSAGQPGGWKGIAYFRLHGSPEMYSSAYGHERLTEIAGQMRECAECGPAWCVFDNTKWGAAVVDALALAEGHLGCRSDEGAAEEIRSLGAR